MSAHHSYHTLLSSHFLHIFALTLDSGGTRRGSFNGKYNGNHENIPVENDSGAMLISDDTEFLLL
eukprot:CAMPEP_0197741108 /NCGR_PEP_ID=MMETSP1435-20131217/26442_1 /TAXON_ID=426625 /ORGANISM="Chaetoceros brevis, Strain CCMP164" /LENGTH=64 /DNA_ID=CAMNT_0043331075 /DNA_START=110 /DNA_END=301 /DNA_ORIENTATION=-